MNIVRRLFAGALLASCISTYPEDSSPALTRLLGDAYQPAATSFEVAMRTAAGLILIERELVSRAASAVVPEEATEQTTDA